jgi:hypothetical protein
MTRTRTAALATGAALLLATAACSSSDNGRSSSPADEAALRQAVQDSVDAINEGDVQAILDAQSARCRDRTSEAEAQQAVDLMETLYGDVTLQSLDILEFNEDGAVVKGTTGIQALDEADDGTDGARWIYEDGAWRDDDC